MIIVQEEGTADAHWTQAFPWSQELVRVNKDFFANSGFRRNQLEAINATMSGRDCFVLMPTGGGAPLVFCPKLGPGRAVHSELKDQSLDKQYGSVVK